MDELGVDPGIELQEQYLAILRGDTYPVAESVEPLLLELLARPLVDLGERLLVGDRLLEDVLPDRER